MVRSLSMARAPRPLRPRERAQDDVPDSELVARAKARDRAAEEAIYRRHVSYVGGMVARLLAGDAEVDDVVQETFTIALEGLTTLRDTSSLRSWIAQIAVSRVRRRFRRRRLLRALGWASSGNEASLEALALPDCSVDARTELIALGRALSRLPTEERIAWSLRYI